MRDSSVTGSRGRTPWQFYDASQRTGFRSKPRIGLAVVPVLALLFIVSPPSVSPAAAQDFLFSSPSGTFGLRGGWNVARAGSDIFEDLTSEFTLDRSDFDGFVGGADLGISLTRRLDLMLGGSYSSRGRVPSEYIEWEGADGEPILQTTRLEQIPLTGGLKLYLTPRGNSIGQFAWVPSRIALYVGGAGGMVHHRFEFAGEFIDEADCNDEGCIILENTLGSNGWSPTVHAFGGMDISITRRGFLTLEARQAWASADLDEKSFQDFEPIDLNGLQLTLGWSWRF